MIFAEQPKNNVYIKINVKQKYINDMNMAITIILLYFYKDMSRLYDEIKEKYSIILSLLLDASDS